MFRYLGEKDGIFRIGASENGATMVASCSNPCQVVKVTLSAGSGLSTKRIQFNPETVMGGALTDAFSGQMEVYRRKASADTEADDQ